MHAQIPPLIGHWQTDCLLQHLGEDQTGNRMRHIRATWRVFQNLKVQMLVGFNSSGACVCVRVRAHARVCVCVGIQCYATLKHISTLVLSICSQLQASDCHSASHNNQHFVLLYYSLVNMHVLALVNITLLAFRCCLNFLLTGNCKLFHSILSYLFFRSQSWGRVSFQGDKESHEVVTFVFLVIHKVLAIPKHLCLCSSMKCLENHLAQIL